MGLDDAHFYGLHDFQKALADVPATEPRLLLVHSPEVIPEAAAYGFCLYLAGHTHRRADVPARRPFTLLQCPLYAPANRRRVALRQHGGLHLGRRRLVGRFWPFLLPAGDRDSPVDDWLLVLQPHLSLASP